MINTSCDSSSEDSREIEQYHINKEPQKFQICYLLGDKNTSKCTHRKIKIALGKYSSEAILNFLEQWKVYVK